VWKETRHQCILVQVGGKKAFTCSERDQFGGAPGKSTVRKKITLTAAVLAVTDHPKGGLTVNGTRRGEEKGTGNGFTVCGKKRGHAGDVHLYAMKATSTGKFLR